MNPTKVINLKNETLIKTLMEQVLQICCFSESGLSVFDLYERRMRAVFLKTTIDRLLNYPHQLNKLQRLNESFATIFTTQSQIQISQDWLWQQRLFSQNQLNYLTTIAALENYLTNSYLTSQLPIATVPIFNYLMTITKLMIVDDYYQYWKLNQALNAIFGLDDQADNDGD